MRTCSHVVFSFYEDSVSCFVWRAAAKRALGCSLSSPLAEVAALSLCMPKLNSPPTPHHSSRICGSCLHPVLTLEPWSPLQFIPLLLSALLVESKPCHPATNATRLSRRRPHHRGPSPTALPGFLTLPPSSSLLLLLSLFDTFFTKQSAKKLSFQNVSRGSWVKGTWTSVLFL